MSEDTINAVKIIILSKEEFGKLKKDTIKYVDGLKDSKLVQRINIELKKANIVLNRKDSWWENKYDEFCIKMSNNPISICKFHINDIADRYNKILIRKYTDEEKTLAVTALRNVKTIK